VTVFLQDAGLAFYRASFGVLRPAEIAAADISGLIILQGRLEAIPIVVLITLPDRRYHAQQGIFHFRNSAPILCVDMVGILVLRELGVLIVAIMVAGRSGSATRRAWLDEMREEIDALSNHGP